MLFYSSCEDMAENRSEWEDLTVAQLKEELEGRGLELTGRKADLIARLVENDQRNSTFIFIFQFGCELVIRISFTF